MMHIKTLTRFPGPVKGPGGPGTLQTTKASYQLMVPNPSSHSWPPPEPSIVVEPWMAMEVVKDSERKKVERWIYNLRWHQSIPYQIIATMSCILIRSKLWGQNWKGHHLNGRPMSNKDATKTWKEKSGPSGRQCGCSLCRSRSRLSFIVNNWAGLKKHSSSPCQKAIKYYIQRFFGILDRYIHHTSTTSWLHTHRLTSYPRPSFLSLQKPMSWWSQQATFQVVTL